MKNTNIIKATWNEMDTWGEIMLPFAESIQVEIVATNQACNRETGTLGEEEN